MTLEAQRHKRVDTLSMNHVLFWPRSVASVGGFVKLFKASSKLR